MPVSRISGFSKFVSIFGRVMKVDLEVSFGKMEMCDQSCGVILGDSDSGLKASTPTPAPTPLRLWPNKRYSSLKRAI